MIKVEFFRTWEDVNKNPALTRFFHSFAKAIKWIKRKRWKGKYFPSPRITETNWKKS